MGTSGHLESWGGANANGLALGVEGMHVADPASVPENIHLDIALLVKEDTDARIKA